METQTLKKGWKEWRWINKSLADLMGRTPVEVATMKKHHRASLEWPSWLVGVTHPSSVNHGGQQPLQVYNRFQCQVSSQLLLVFSSIRNTIYGFLDHRQLMQNVSKIQFEMEIRIWADLIWILLIRQCIQMIFSFAGPNPKRLYKSLYIIISALQIFISKPLMLILALLTAYLKYIFFNYEDTKVFC